MFWHILIAFNLFAMFIIADNDTEALGFLAIALTCIVSRQIEQRPA